MSLDNENFVLITSVVALFALFSITIGSMTYYSSTSTDYVKNDQISQDKITALNQAFRSALGPKWPYMFLVFITILGIAIFSFYISTKNNAISISMDENHAEKFNIIFMYFVIFFSIFVILLCVKQYLDYRKTKNTAEINNYIPSINLNNTDKQILIILGLILFIVIGGGFAIKYIFKK